MSDLNDFKIENGKLVGYHSNDEIVTIPDGVTSIGNEVFKNCESLQEITILDGVTSIGNEVFKNCESLQKITIPDSITSIGNGVFNGCSSLEEITILNSIVSTDILWYRDIFYSGDVSFEDGPFSVSGIPLVDSSFLKIFMKDATPKLIFNTIKDVFNGEVEATLSSDDLRDWIRYIDIAFYEADTAYEEEYGENDGCEYDENAYDDFCEGDVDEIFNCALQDNSEWIPDFINHLYCTHYRKGCWVEIYCTINLLKYAKAHSELYMFQLEILSAFIEKLGATQETDIIIETILNATQVLAENQELDSIEKLLTEDIYKDLWFDDSIKIKVSNLIKYIYIPLGS